MSSGEPTLLVASYWKHRGYIYADIPVIPGSGQKLVKWQSTVCCTISDALPYSMRLIERDAEIWK